MPDLKKLASKLAKKKAVFLDLDNTLYAYAPCHNAGLTAAHSLYRRSVERITFRKFHSLYRAARRTVHARLPDQAGGHSRLLYFQAMLEGHSARTDFRRTVPIEKAYWAAFQRKMRLHGWVGPFLKECRRRGVKVVLVTNLTAEIQFKKVLRLGLEGRIDLMVSSEEAGIEKPAAAFFRYALRKAGCSASSTVLIGDDARSDSCRFIDCVRLSS